MAEAKAQGVLGAAARKAKPKAKRKKAPKVKAEKYSEAWQLEDCWDASGIGLADLNRAWNAASDPQEMNPC